MPGRPLEFEPAAAIERAMYAFWHAGYAATSVQDLVEATGVPRQSIYNTLGDKRTLYLSALECYIEIESERLAGLRSAEGDLQMLAAYLEDTVRELTLTGIERHGLFHANAAAELGPHDEAVAALIQRHMRSTSAAFARALRQGVDARQVRADIDTTVAARGLAQLLQGMAIASRAGATRRSLLEVASNAIHSLSA